MTSKTSLFHYTLHLADNTLILGQRNSEWCGHGPVLEQDIAITNISLDLLGQARNFFQYAATVYNGMSDAEKKLVDQSLPRLWKNYGREMQEDDLAFLREERQYLNLLLCELPKGDWAFAILRQFFFSQYQSLLYEQLQKSKDEQLAAIAEKSSKEVAYHVRWSSEWVARLGDGTEESRKRINSALAEMWMFTGEMFIAADYEKKVTEAAIGANIASLSGKWTQKINQVFEQAGLAIPPSTWMQQGGKEGKHSEYLGYVLTEMQYLQRTYPNAVW